MTGHFSRPVGDVMAGTKGRDKDVPLASATGSTSLFGIVQRWIAISGSADVLSLMVMS